MKKYIAILLCFMLAIPVQAKKKEKGGDDNSKKSEQKCIKKARKGKKCYQVPAFSITTAEDSLSYAYGMAIGKQTVNMFKQMSADLNYTLSSDIIMKAFKTQIDNDSTSVLLTDEQLGNIYKQTNEKVRLTMDAKRKIEADKNKHEGDAFLAKTATEPGVQKTASGLMYKVDTMGTGNKPAAGEQVKVNYIGKLIDGKEFDNSYKRGEPLTLSLDGVIKGWQEGLMLMPVGSKFTLYIPSDLGYGDNGQGPIPGSSVLIFDVELLETIPGAK
ncbi:MAG: FKBP-type peptidyl-prolyl cis-trans isomerase [Bacteroidales bacterium]